MKQADRIRQFAPDHYVALARVGGRSEITIRAGDVHQAMGLANAMPAVCSAIGSNKFNELASVTPGARTGPANGANVYFQFHVAVNPSSGLSPLGSTNHFLGRHIRGRAAISTLATHSSWYLA